MAAHRDRLVDASVMRKLLEVFSQNLTLYNARATTWRLQGQLAQSRSAIQRHGPRQTARRLHLLVSTRIDEHRLPDTVSRTALVSGFAGQCEACDGYLPLTQLVMATPHTDTFVYLDAECYVIWKAQCHLRAALRRIA